MADDRRTSTVTLIAGRNDAYDDEVRAILAQDKLTQSDKAPKQRIDEGEAIQRESSSAVSCISWLCTKMSARLIKVTS